MPFARLRQAAGEIAEIAAAIVRRIAVEDFGIPAALRHADAMLQTGSRREVQTDHEEVVGILATTQVSQRAFLMIVAIDPLEAAALKIELVQRPFGLQQVIQVGHALLDAVVRRQFEQVPLQVAVAIPLLPLTQLERFPWTTSSCDNGSTKFSWKAYSKLNVMSL